MTDEYKNAVGYEYPRPASEAAADTAGALNNRALSFCDLGKYEQAEECWKKALEINPDSYDAVFNRLLAGWRRGERSPAYLEDGLDIIPDEELRQEMKEEILREKTDRIVFHPEGLPENSGVSYTGFSADRKRGCGLIVNTSGEELSQFAVVCSLPEEKILFAKEIRYYEYTSLGKTYRAENSIMISDDGRFAFLYETTQDHWYLFEVETGDLLWEYFGDGSIYKFDDYEEMRMSPDGRFAALNNGILWNLEEDAVVFEKEEYWLNGGFTADSWFCLMARQEHQVCTLRQGYQILRLQLHIGAASAPHAPQSRCIQDISFLVSVHRRDDITHAAPPSCASLLSCFSGSAFCFCFFTFLGL